MPQCEVLKIPDVYGELTFSDPEGSWMGDGKGTCRPATLENSKVLFGNFSGSTCSMTQAPFAKKTHLSLVPDKTENQDSTKVLPLFSKDSYRTFSSEELDTETGLYYFGARYYDPRTSVWQSADPMIKRYLDGKGGNGVFNSFNLGLYSYGYLNPLKYIDPDGLLSTEATSELQGHEDSTDYMYRDTTGHTTVGIGHQISSENEAQQIKFNNGDKPATTAEISTGFKAVKNSTLPLNTRASSFASLSTLRAPQSVITELFTGDVASAEAGAKSIFAGYDSYPESVKTALVDMVFNLGAAGVKNKFQDFVKAVTARNWTEAAKESNRPQIGADRNAYIKALFENAAKEPAKDTKANTASK